MNTQSNLEARHSHNNRATAAHWELYAEHRARLLALIREVGGGARGRRLCVLGAGNANDLALDELVRDGATVHLVDLDGEALARAIARQAPATRQRLVTHARVDASGLLAALPAWRERGPTPAEVSAAARATADGVAGALPGRFDLVVSDCLLSQIYWSCFEALGEGPLLTAVVHAALAAHIGAMARLAAPGGRCLLVTDAVSSDTVPLEALYAAGDGRSDGRGDGRGDGRTLLAALDGLGALFTGTSPRLVHETIARAGGDVDEASVWLSRPWLWRVESTRTVLVYGCAFGPRRSVA